MIRAAVVGLVVASICVVVTALRRRHMQYWLPAYFAQLLRGRRVPRGGPVELILCVADHYEPKGGGASPEVAWDRVRAWVEDYPRLLGAFRDSDGRPPRHTFFYPAEEYEPKYLDALAGLCRDGFGEVEVHLHHDGDTSANLLRTLREFTQTLADRHGLLARDPATGAPVFAFIHGNWALDNSRPDGRLCGVNDELSVLIEAGCYADMTMPSAPSPTQTRTINGLYYAVDDPAKPKSHDRGTPLGAGPRPPGSLLMVQGPLSLDWRHRRVENGCLQASQPPGVDRLDAWLAAGVGVPSRPDWRFVKLHTHGAVEANRAAILGPPGVDFHRALADRAAADPGFRFHYVTAREMVNLAHAAEAGWGGTVDQARDYLWKWEPAR